MKEGPRSPSLLPTQNIRERNMRWLWTRSQVVQELNRERLERTRREVRRAKPGIRKVLAAAQFIVLLAEQRAAER